MRAAGCAPSRLLAARPARSALPSSAPRTPPVRRRACAPRALAEHVQPLWDLAVGVGLPCTVMNCGDAVYRSTLDAKLRLEEARPRILAAVTYRSLTRACAQPPLITDGGFVILLLLLGYFAPPPGALAGFLDYYVLAPIAKARQPRYGLDDFVFQKKLGEGGFGDVWLCDNLRNGKAAVVKRAYAFGQVEAWMNERASRACPGSTAAFLGSFSDSRAPKLPATGGGGAEGGRKAAFQLPELPDWSDLAAGRFPWSDKPGNPSQRGGAPGDALWLVWDLEGTASLAQLIDAPDFPYNLETGLFGAPLQMPPGPQRKAASVRALMAQLLGALKALHATGIVHRDVKPENFVLADADVPGKARLLLIDLGAAADLRVGINYAPREYLLDPRFCGPEQYVMSRSTPQAPPVPVALLLSPALWQLNLPDRFDMYAAGLVLLQMALPSLRTDNSLVAMRRAWDKGEHDLEAWRDVYERRGLAGNAEGWALLDADDGAGWELVRRLCRIPAPQRLSAAAAARHRFLSSSSSSSSVAPRLLRGVDTALGALGDSPQGAQLGSQTGWVLRRMARSGTARGGGFTEAQMERIAALERTPTAKEASSILGRKGAAGTIAASEGSKAPARRRRALEETRTVAAKAREVVLGQAGLGRLNFWGVWAQTKQGEADV